MYFITTKRMLEVCFFQHTPTFIIEPDKERQIPRKNPSVSAFVLFFFIRGTSPVCGHGKVPRRSARAPARPGRTPL